MTNLLEAALSTWALTWAVSFWYKLDPLREWLGIYKVYDGQGYATDRTDGGGLGGWFNCPQCASVLVFPLGWLLRRWLAPLGLALILVRWWESTRVKAEWWL